MSEHRITRKETRMGFQLESCPPPLPPEYRKARSTGFIILAGLGLALMLLAGLWLIAWGCAQ